MRQYKVFGFFIQVILFVHCSFCGFERTSQPTSAFARAFSGTALYDYDNLWLNPAALSNDSSFQSSVFYSPSPFQLDQLSNYGLITIHRFDFLNVGVGLNSFGFSLYRESTVSITGGTMITESFGAGMSVHLCHLIIEGYGSSSSGVVDLGAIYSVLDDINIGISINNLTGAAFGGEDDIPTVFLSGVSYRMAENALANLDMIKDVRYNTAFRAGFEFSPHEIVVIRGGTQGQPSRLFGGLGITIVPFQINYAVATHSELGLTHSIGITIRQ